MSTRGTRGPVILAVIFASAALSAALLTACGGTAGSGVAATQTRDLVAFSGVDLAGNSIVAVHVGGKQSVVVHADSNLLRQVTTPMLWFIPD